MISRNLFTDVLLIAMLVTLQIFLFNRIDIAGKYTPVIYIIFVLFYPFYRNLYIFLSASFILGLSIDAFLGTWGINAFATTLIAYFRTIIFKIFLETRRRSCGRSRRPAPIWVYRCPPTLAPAT